MSNDNADDAEALLQEAKNQKRHQTDPDAPVDDSEQSLADAIAGAYEELEDGDLPENLTIRDGNLAALFAGLDETDKLGGIIQDAADALDRDEADAESKAAALRLLVRVGLEEVAPDTLEAGAEGYEQHREQQDYEF